MAKFEVECVMKDIREKIADKKMRENDLSYVTYYHKKLLNALREYNKLIIFGAGNYGKIVLRDLKQHGFENICCLCDNKINVSEVDGTEVITPDEAVERYPEACYVITPKNYENEIMLQLTDMGVKIQNIKIFNVENAGLIVM